MGNPRRAEGAPPERQVLRETATGYVLLAAVLVLALVLVADPALRPALAFLLVIPAQGLLRLHRDPYGP